MKNRKFTLAETFVGAGGNHIGWSKAGFQTVYINDINQDMLNTITYNNKDLKNAFVDDDSILDINTSKALEKMSLKSGELDVLFGGIVCKGFSLAGERSPMDERNYFYHAQLKLVKEWKPKISVIENVHGILSAKILAPKTPKKHKDNIEKIWNDILQNKIARTKNQITPLEKTNKEMEFQNLKAKKKDLLEKIEKEGFFISVLDDIKNLYDKLGYNVYHKILKSTDFGVASIRKRVFIVAVRKDLTSEYHFPKPTQKTPKTVRQALSKINYAEEDSDNIPMNHRPNVVERFSYISEGKNIADIMEEIPPHLRINKFFSRGSNMRLAWDFPAPTLVPGHSAFPLHPKENRSITVREAAAITGFPNKYKFFGNHSRRCEQVGNAIPPKLAEAVAKSVRELLEKECE